ncbi:Major Facilitator Superfamily protein [Rhodococcus triatomae]|uniref:Major Facilitator Superfamily protein n=1 Tax=Rhodococcus triatomae TaxID=300028 RepID=A0A1G8HX43_9NOCA|nr:MFS transporter [Rhodococcus triatomae]SDI11184.1 Major Facilitator Superfamily protein [Rhodococcus triatomae]
MYALLFEDYGLSTAQISSLFVIWSVTSFVSEIPSGAWADTVSRRGLLGGSAVLYSAGFAVWMLAPSYAGFAVGFVLWGVSGSLQSGTFEALLYDELTARGGSDRYAAIMGYANSGSQVCVLVATLAAAPLFALGGYPLVGWISVAITVGNGLLVAALPSAPRRAETSEFGPAHGVLSRYTRMLREGAGEVFGDRLVRRAVVLTALLTGFLAYDEYFTLVARDGGAETSEVPVLVAITVVGQVVGTALAGRTARMRGATMAVAVTVGAAALGAGALLGGVWGFAALGAGYGIVANAMIVSEARLQDSIRGSARATVTSAAGFLSEVSAVVIYALFALGSTWYSTAVLVAALSVPLLGTALLSRRWLPTLPG